MASRALQASGLNFREMRLDRDRRAVLHASDLESQAAGMWVRAIDARPALADRLYALLSSAEPGADVRRVAEFLSSDRSCVVRALVDLFQSEHGSGAGGGLECVPMAHSDTQQLQLTLTEIEARLHKRVVLVSPALAACLRCSPDVLSLDQLRTELHSAPDPTAAAAALVPVAWAALLETDRQIVRRAVRLAHAAGDTHLETGLVDLTSRCPSVNGPLGSDSVQVLQEGLVQEQDLPARSAELRASHVQWPEGMGPTCATQRVTVLLEAFSADEARAQLGEDAGAASARRVVHLFGLLMRARLPLLRARAQERSQQRAQQRAQEEAQQRACTPLALQQIPTADLLMLDAPPSEQLPSEPQLFLRAMVSLLGPDWADAPTPAAPANVAPTGVDVAPTALAPTGVAPTGVAPTGVAPTALAPAAAIGVTAPTVPTETVDAAYVAREAARRELLLRDEIGRLEVRSSTERKEHADALHRLTVDVQRLSKEMLDRELVEVNAAHAANEAAEAHRRASEERAAAKFGERLRAAEGEAKRLAAQLEDAKQELQHSRKAQSDASERAGRQREAAATLEQQLRRELQSCRTRLVERTEQLLSLADESGRLHDGSEQGGGKERVATADAAARTNSTSDDLMSRQLLWAAKEIHSQAKAEREASRCAVCLEGARDTVLMPCRHAVLCEGCAGLVRQTSGRCPVCRAGIDSTLSIFG